MFSFTQQSLFVTRKFSITGKGLVVSTQWFFGFSLKEISFERMGEETVLGKTFNKDLIHTAIVLAVLMIARYAIINSFADVWMILLSAGLIITPVYTLLFPKVVFKEPELEILKLLPAGANSSEITLFLKTLFEVRDEYLHFLALDSKNKTVLLKSFTELVTLGGAGVISKEEFELRKKLLKSKAFPDLFERSPREGGRSNFLLN
jgi:hypothetical protein